MIEAEKRKLENEKKNVELVNCYKRMAQTEDGKKILSDLEWMCCAKRTIVGTANNSEGKPNLDRWNTNQTFHHEGMRNVYLYINEKINRKEKKNGD